MRQNNAKRIAIVGSGGAGMTAAWLLDEGHDVTVFERSAVLGGHAHTTVVELDGRSYFADDGFGWFSDTLYPTFMRLLEIHGIRTELAWMTLSFTQRQQNRTWLLPPMTLGSAARTLLDIPGIFKLLRLNKTISLASPVVHGQEQSLTWSEFLQRTRFPERYCREFLTPLVAGGWGAPLERAGEFAAYTLTKYFVSHRPHGLSRYPWHVIPDGAASYIQRIAQTLKRAELHTKTTITNLQKNASGWTLTDDRGVPRHFDAVLLATGARDAQQILRRTEGIEETKRVLNQFEYYTVRLATHTDTSFMPARRSDWGIANIISDGASSRLSVWVGRDHNANVFTSYIGDREPKDCRHISTFNLPFITPAHYRAQQQLAMRQGQDGLWFAGDWVQDIGCHEDAVVSAMRVAEGIDQESPRLTALRSPRIHPSMLPLPGFSPILRPRKRARGRLIFE